jgi:iron complex transport system permease protein
MIVRDHSLVLLPTLVLAILCALVVACLFGTQSISLPDIVRGLLNQGDLTTRLIIWDIRLPRALAALMVGMALGASGAALQGLLRNPLAEPGVLGVSTCSSLMATIVIYWGLVEVSPWVLPLATIVGALVATLILAVAAPRVGSVVTLILIGVGLSSFAGALMSLLLNFAPNPFTLSDMVTWMMGSVANRSFSDLVFAGPFWIAGFIVLALVAPGLRALALGDEGASALGLNINLTRAAIVLGAGLATGAAVSIAGAVGFVGIVAPHLVRPLVGYDAGRTLLPSALLGGLILILADCIARLVPTEQELKLGVVAALIGAPIFIWIAARRTALGDGA